MNNILLGLIVGVSVGVIIGTSLAISVVSCLRYRRSSVKHEDNSSHKGLSSPVVVNGAESSAAPSDSVGESPRISEWSNLPPWMEGLKKKKNAVSACGIPKYTYKEVQKATSNFTTLIGKGAFGAVYKARMASGETVAVKTLGSNSRQEEKDFFSEVMLLGRLHHKNLVNLVGYTAEKGLHMLLFVYMSNGNLASQLYGDNHAPLSWITRVRIALDVARGLEYLHYGATPPVVHRDIKPSNILLDQSMRARVSDFGLSRQEMVTPRLSNVKGTFGYVDPEYMSTKTFTKKSDVYSFGVLLFELITSRNPQQGLMEYVELAAMNGEGKVGWEEIVDSNLNGQFALHDLNALAALAFKCVNCVSKNRPSIREAVQVLSQLYKAKEGVELPRKSFAEVAEQVRIEIEPQETQIET